MAGAGILLRSRSKVTLGLVVIVASICFCVFIGYLPTLGANRIYLFENPPIYCHFDKQTILYASKNIVRGWTKSAYQEVFDIDMRGTLGYPHQFTRSKNVPIIACILLAAWGAAIIFVLGAICYSIVIKLLVEKKRKDEMKGRKSN
jgi:hypothetical protein